MRVCLSIVRLRKRRKRQPLLPLLPRTYMRRDRCSRLVSLKRLNPRKRKVQDLLFNLMWLELEQEPSPDAYAGRMRKRRRD
jgi:hypothetical protein